MTTTTTTTTNERGLQAIATKMVVEGGVPLLAYHVGNKTVLLNLEEATWFVAQAQDALVLARAVGLLAQLETPPEAVEVQTLLLRARAAAGAHESVAHAEDDGPSGVLDAALEAREEAMDDLVDGLRAFDGLPPLETEAES